MSKKKKESAEKRIVGTSMNVPINKVRANAFNYNKQSSFVFEKMRESLQEFGFVDPIEVRSGNQDGEFGYFEVIGGEHRLKAAESLGFEDVPVVDLGNVADAQAKKLCIVLNETKGRPDNDALAALISDLNNEVGEEGLGVLPYEQDELDAFLEMSGGSDWDELSEDPDDLDGMEGADEGGASAKQKTLAGVMGLLDISKEKETLLVDQFEELVRLTESGANPTRLTEKIIRSALRKERKKAKEVSE